MVKSSSFLLRVEALNLGATLFDSDDLSTIRGANTAMLLLPQRILAAASSLLGQVDEVFAGASQAVGLLTCGEDTDQIAIELKLDLLARGDIPIGGLEDDLAKVLPFLTIYAVAVPCEGSSDYATARMQALTRMRVLQMQAPTLEPEYVPKDGLNRPCQVDRLRAAVEIDRKGDEKRLVSRAVAVRRELGRTMRSEVYERILGQSYKHDFAMSFSDLVDEPEIAQPPSLAGKMAVVHLDGNAFTKRREAAIAAADEPAEMEACFAETVKQAQSKLIRRLFDHFCQRPDMFILRKHREQDRKRLRFETLVWGGDEAVMVLPAWMVWDILPILADAIDDSSWTFQGEKLTQSIGVLICHHRMPISETRRLAESVMETAKSHAKSINSDVPPNVLSVQLIEGLGQVGGSLSGYRKSRYGSDEASGFSVAGIEGIRHFHQTGTFVCSDQGAPRSQIYNLLREFGAQRHELAANNVRSAYTSAVETLVKRRENVDDRSLDENLQDALIDPTWGGNSSNLPELGLIRLVELWDCINAGSQSQGLPHVP